MEDRQGNRDLFTLAHRIGRIVEAEFGCPLHYDEEQDAFSDRCPIKALHSSVGMSIAWFHPTRCSICDATDFECDHVPGRTYDGSECSRVPDGPVIDHIAVTPNPDFAYTFHTWTPIPRSSIENDLGRRLRPGETVVSNHCRDCPGADFGPTAEDLDPMAAFESGRRP